MKRNEKIIDLNRDIIKYVYICLPKAKLTKISIHWMNPYLRWIHPLRWLGLVLLVVLLVCGTLDEPFIPCMSIHFWHSCSQWVRKFDTVEMAFFNLYTYISKTCLVSMQNLLSQTSFARMQNCFFLQNLACVNTKTCVLKLAFQGSKICFPKPTLCQRNTFPLRPALQERKTCFSKPTLREREKLIFPNPGLH